MKIWWTPLAFGILVLMLSGFLFGWLVEDVVTGDPITVVDQQIHDWFIAHATPGFTKFMLGMSFLASSKVYKTLIIIIAVILIWRRLWYWLISFTFITVGGMMLNFLLKCAVHRPRPSSDVLNILLNSYSFPSSHAMRATLMYGFLAVLGYYLLPSKELRNVTISLMLILIFLICFSRIYLGFHYLTDVLGGITAGITWLMVCFISTSALFGAKNKRLAAL